MGDWAFWHDDPDEAPVPLVDTGGARGEEPVLLGASVVEEAERILAAAPDEPEEPAAEAGDRAWASFRVPRPIAACLMALVCVGAFGHGWHVGSQREAAARHGGAAVNEITGELQGRQ